MNDSTSSDLDGIPDWLNEELVRQNKERSGRPNPKLTGSTNKSLSEPDVHLLSIRDNNETLTFKNRKTSK